jgi:putative hydrolase of HD superfamily
MSVDRDIEFLYEIGTLRLTQRQWKRFLNPDFANLADHHLRVIWTALTIAKYEKADANKVMKMALVHDIAESRTGDVDYLSRQYVERNSELGLEDMVKDISLEKELLDLQKEYEERKTLEAKIVKDADNLDIDFELQEQKVRGFHLEKTWQEQRQYVYEKKLYTKTARRIWKSIQKSNPHDWHTKGRNRINSGDWKN